MNKLEHKTTAVEVLIPASKDASWSIQVGRKGGRGRKDLRIESSGSRADLRGV